MPGDLDAIVVPGDAHRCIRCLVDAVHHGVPHKLLQRAERVASLPPLHRSAGDIDRGPDVRLEFFIESSHQVSQRAVDLLLIHDGISQINSIDAEELHVRSGKKIPRPRGEDQEAKRRGNVVLNRGDHLGGREALLVGAIVRFQDVGRQGRWQVLVLEQDAVQIRDRGRWNRPGVEGLVAMPTLLVEDAFILC